MNGKRATLYDEIQEPPFKTDLEKRLDEQERVIEDLQRDIFHLNKKRVRAEKRIGKVMEFLLKQNCHVEWMQGYLEGHSMMPFYPGAKKILEEPLPEEDKRITELRRIVQDGQNV